MKLEYECETCGRKIVIDGECESETTAKTLVDAIEKESSKHEYCTMARINALKMKAAGY